jgi:ATP-binding protein involved in chromosome partitioning
MQTKEAVIRAISEIYHPAINLTLVELGIVQDIDLWDETVIITFVFPFPNIPIAGKLIDSVQQVVEGMGLKLEYIVRIMKEHEKQAFLLKEKKAWKGL